MKLVLEYDLNANPLAGTFANYLRVLAKSLDAQTEPTEDLRKVGAGPLIETRDPHMPGEPIVARLTLVKEEFVSGQEIDDEEVDKDASGVYNETGKVEELSDEANH